MANTHYQSVDEYLAAQPESVRAQLVKVRAAIRKALPEAREVTSYQIPAYRLPAGMVIYFAGWKEHYSIYPVTEGILAEFKDELGPYEVGKGTIRFPLSGRVPVGLIGRIAKLRAKEVAARKR